ncbi:MAG: cytidylate kinase [Sphingobacteriales bacterium]
MKPIIIAIDGHSSCGKSTVAKELAKRFNLKYLDTGAMFRAVCLYFIQKKVNLNNKLQVISALADIELTFKTVNQQQHIYLNSEDVEEEIRLPHISDKVSEVSTIAEVRSLLLALQRKIASKESSILDGRDIGTVVFPNADLKIFMTAEPKIRAQRRLEELQAKNVAITLEEVLENLTKRDKIDSERKISPLKQAEDAFVLDNSYLNRDEQFAILEDKITSLSKSDSF